MNISKPNRVSRLALPERSDLIGMSVRAAERELQDLVTDGPCLDLTYADTKRFPPPDGVIEKMLKAALYDGMSYTPYRGDVGVRASVSANLGAFVGFDVDADTELLLSPGSQSAVFCALSSIVEEGDRVLLFDPDYLSSERMLRHLGAEVVHIPVDWAGDEPSPDLQRLEKELRSNPRLLLFSNPNNPTGAVYSGQIISEIARLVSETKDTTVIVDELYSRLVFEGEYAHIVAEEGMRERTVTILGPSKSESMSGFRLGAAVGPRELIDRMEDVLSLTGLRAPAYAQHMLLGWMRDDLDFMARRIDEYRLLRDHAVERFNASGVLKVVRPRGTAYMFPRVLGDVSDQVIAARMKTEANIIINPGYQSGPGGLGHFRVCFAQREEVWDQAVEDIINVVRNAVG